MTTYLKSYYKLYTAIILLFLAGCAALQTPTGKAVFNIAMRSIAYEVGKKNPDSVGKMLDFASFLSGFETYLSPTSFAIAVDKEIRDSDLDDFQKANVSDLAAIVKEQYSLLHEKYGEALTKNQALEVVRAIGSSISFGLKPSVDGSAEFVLESDSLIVVVD